MYTIDLFSGAGGLSQGLALAGFQTNYACEINPVYGKTYQENHPKTTFSNENIREVKPNIVMKQLKLDEGEIDLVAGGPPCQGFSINAPIRSLEDDRNKLFYEFMRFVDCFRPKAVLIENVTGIISLGKGSVVEEIYNTLEKMDYNVQHKILFAAHYGVPQTRFRTFFIGIRNGFSKFSFPSPTHYAESKANFTGSKELCIKILPLFSDQMQSHTTVWDAISDLHGTTVETPEKLAEYSSPPSSEYQEVMREGATDTVQNHCSSQLGKINLERLKHIPQGGSWRDIPYGLLPKGMQRARRSDHTKRYGRLDPAGLCSTILTKCDPHWGSFFHPMESRVLSVREAARIQSFNDSFIFTGSLTAQYEQIGNAVPPLLAKAVGEQIAKAIGIPKGRYSNDQSEKRSVRNLRP